MLEAHKISAYFRISVTPTAQGSNQTSHFHPEEFCIILAFVFIVPAQALVFLLRLLACGIAIHVK